MSPKPPPIDDKGKFVGFSLTLMRLKLREWRLLGDYVFFVKQKFHYMRVNLN
jgi:hypothetical protein